MGENSFGYDRKKSKKILEKCEMSFCSSENKNWTFRGSFCFFLGIFPVFCWNFIVVPLTGTVVSVNYDVVSNPEKLNPNVWIFEIKAS